MPDAEVWCLWFRKDRSQPWECVSTGDSEAACSPAAADCGTGDYYTKRGTDRPTNASLCWDRKPRKT